MKEDIQNGNISFSTQNSQTALLLQIMQLLQGQNQGQKVVKHKKQEVKQGHAEDNESERRKKNKRGQPKHHDHGH